MPEIPDKPSITAEEIGAAMVVANKLSIPISTMDMEQILAAAFDHRHQRFNAALRDEALFLEKLVNEYKQYAENHRAWIKSRYDVASMIGLTQKLLRLLKDTTIMQAAETYRELHDLMEDSVEIRGLKSEYDDD